MNTPQRAPADALRRLAFDELYIFPGTQERGESEIDINAEMESLCPADRESVMRMATRRLAFQVLFEIDARNISDLSFIEQYLGTIEDLGPVGLAHTANMVRQALKTQTRADAQFRALAPEWPTHRLAGVDRAILRLAYWEIATKTNPPAVVINEAVELCRHFSTDKSPAFINALLDKVAKTEAASALTAGGT
jgi:transcription antitermination protein NusB